MKVLSRLILTLFLSLSCAFLTMGAVPAPQKIGIVIMHGKGSSPSKHVSDLASFLEDRGYLVANLVKCHGPGDATMT